MTYGYDNDGLLISRVRARPVLFLPAGSGASVGGFALRGTESSARGHGGGAGDVALVECRCPLWYCGAGCLSGDGNVASTLVGFQLAKFPGRRGNGIRPCGSSPARIQDVR